jgi:dipeptidyl aminopeptidase/acylaminoacyl peptidase
MRFISACAALAAAGAVFGQGSDADYRRAAGFADAHRPFAPAPPAPPVWSADGPLVKRSLDGEDRIFRVDPASGRLAEAFDHAPLYASMEREAGRPLRAIGRFDLEDGVLHFVWPDQERAAAYRPRERRLELMPLAESGRFRLANLRRPRPSRSGGPAIQLRLHNPSSRELEAFWIDTEGELRSYAKIGPGKSWQIATYAGHVWQLKDSDGGSWGVFQGSLPSEHAVAESTPDDPEAPGRRSRPGGSPDGRHQVSLRDGAAWLQTGGAPARKLSDPIPGQGAFIMPPYWSPDSRRFVLRTRIPGASRQIPIVESSPRSQVQPTWRLIDYLKPGDQVPIDLPVLFDAESGMRIPAPVDGLMKAYQNDGWRWSADSRSFFVRHVPRGHQGLTLFAWDAESGAVRRAADERTATFVDYAQKGWWRLLDSGEVIWMSERSGWNHLYLIDGATGEVKSPITQGEWVVRRVHSVDEQRRQIIVEIGGFAPGEDPYHAHFARVGFDGSGFTRLTEGDGDHSIEFSPDGRWLIDTYSRVDMAPVTELRNAETGALAAELSRGSLAELEQNGWRAPERFAAPGRDGRTMIYGLIIRPSNFDPQKRYPVIENIYAGPHAAHVPKSFAVSTGMNSLAELGFIVVQIDGMGTSERSKAFHDVAWRNIADAGLPDRIAWMRAAAQTRPWMDLDRVGIYGTSAGGQNALGALLQHGDFYKAGVSDCGCHDNRMDKIWWNELWMGEMGPHYEAQSNVTMAGNLRGDLLLMVGEVDTNVDPQSTMQVADALIRADKDFQLLVAPGVGHGVLGTAYGRRQMYDFFVRKLHGREPRWSE